MENKLYVLLGVNSDDEITMFYGVFSSQEKALEYSKKVFKESGAEKYVGSYSVIVPPLWEIKPSITFDFETHEYIESKTLLDVGYWYQYSNFAEPYFSRQFQIEICSIDEEKNETSFLL